MPHTLSRFHDIWQRRFCKLKTKIVKSLGDIHMVRFGLAAFRMEELNLD
ncbi:MAG TPA: hypothetical protein PLY87_29365 [Planctomycetaceae bacterium]|nr:hypothetical protein [Planctomycetaceae bacterium]HQZ69246.1 hypothetical protein [Planctomycetaceae bacterium]HRA88582.1 hypothetical protein [Planctomycetaceae bacterium]